MATRGEKRTEIVQEKEVQRAIRAREMIVGEMEPRKIGLSERLQEIKSKENIRGIQRK